MIGSARAKEETRELYDTCSPELLELFGPHQHDGWYETGSEPRIVAQERLVEVLADRAHVAPGARVLDVGCGVGGTAVWLAEHRGCRVTGVTNSPVQVALARRLAAERGVPARFAVMDAEDLAFEASSFDAVLLIGVLGHLLEQERVLGDIHRLLAPGGTLAIADWVLAPGRSAASLGFLLAAMHAPDIEQAATHARCLERLGFSSVLASDETRHTAPDWRIGARQLARSPSWRLIRKLGARAVPLVAAMSGMKRAIRSGDLRYAFIIATA